MAEPGGGAAGSTPAWSVHAVEVGSGRVVLSEDPWRVLPTASVGKLFLLGRLAEVLALDPARARVVLPRDAIPPVADSGLWQHLAVPALDVEDCARLVGTVSDNLATNVLLDHLGLDDVQEYARRIAPHGSVLHDVVRDERGPDDPRTLSTGCAADWAGFFSDPPARVLDWLSASVDLSLVADAFALDPLSHDGGPVQVWNKTGSDPGTRADVGLVASGGRRVAYAVICRYDPADHRDVVARMRALGTRILSALTD